MGLDWYVVSDNMLLCETAVAGKPFNEDRGVLDKYWSKDPNNTEFFEHSDLKKWLINWLEK